MDDSQTYDYIAKINMPWYLLVTNGYHTVENIDGPFRNMKIGEIIKWINPNNKISSIKTVIDDILVYEHVKTYIKRKGQYMIDDELGTIDMDCGTSIYYKHLTKDDSSIFNVVVLKLSLVVD